MNDFAEFNKRLRSLSLPELRETLTSAGMPPDVRKKADTALEAVEALTKVSPGTSKHENALAYVGYLASLQWNMTAVRQPDLHDIEKMLDDHVRDSTSRQKIRDHLSSKFLNVYKKPRLLVVDDERIALESLAYILEREDYTVETAGNGAEAIEKLKNSDIDIVITDLIMGEVDGTAIIKETISKYPDTRVIMITGYATVDTAVQALRMGAFHYIEKPVKVDDLLSSVRDALRQKYSNRNRNVLCFEGHSREAQISLGEKIAGTLGRKFVNIPLSEIREESDIFGIGRANEAARPGCIIDAVRRTGSAGPVIMLEGLDSVAGDFRGDITSVLMEVISPVKNRKFTDRYLDIPYDLSHVIFIVTAVSTENIKSPLRDILDVVTL